jgi:hypothetical protein
MPAESSGPMELDGAAWPGEDDWPGDEEADEPDPDWPGDWPGDWAGDWAGDDARAGDQVSAQIAVNGGRATAGAIQDPAQAPSSGGGLP